MKGWRETGMVGGVLGFRLSIAIVSFGISYGWKEVGFVVFEGDLKLEGFYRYYNLW